MENKVDVKFKANLQKLKALFNGEVEIPSKILNSEASDVIAELIKEEKAAKIEEFKSKVKTILNEKVLFDKDVEALQKELDKKISDKKEAFSKKMEDCFSIIDSISEIEASYNKSLTGDGL